MQVPINSQVDSSCLCPQCGAPAPVTYGSQLMEGQYIAPDPSRCLVVCSKCGTKAYDASEMVTPATESNP